jgi:hypothetical protein
MGRRRSYHGGRPGVVRDGEDSTGADTRGMAEDACCLSPGASVELVGPRPRHLPTTYLRASSKICTSYMLPL